MKKYTQIQLARPPYVPPEVYRITLSYVPFSECFVCARLVSYADRYSDIYLCSATCKATYCVVAGFWYTYYFTQCMLFMVAYHTLFFVVHSLFIGLWMLALSAQLCMGCYIVWKSGTFVLTLFW